MTISENLQTITHGGGLLMDNNVLSTLKNNPTNPDVRDFLSLLNSWDVTVVVNDSVKLEFLRDTNTDKEYRKRQALIRELCQNVSLKVGTEIYEAAMRLSFLYRSKKFNTHGVDFVDLIISGSLYKNPNLFLVTKNHKDFPIPIHERVGTVVLDLQEKLLDTLGFYRVQKNVIDVELKNLISGREWKQV